MGFFAKLLDLIWTIDGTKSRIFSHYLRKEQLLNQTNVKLDEVQKDISSLKNDYIKLNEDIKIEINNEWKNIILTSSFDTPTKEALLEKKINLGMDEKPLFLFLDFWHPNRIVREYKYGIFKKIVYFNFIPEKEFFSKKLTIINGKVSLIEEGNFIKT